MMKAGSFLLRLAAPLVPGDLRRDWLREWQAELQVRGRTAVARPQRIVRATRAARHPLSGSAGPRGVASRRSLEV